MKKNKFFFLYFFLFLSVLSFFYFLEKNERHSSIQTLSQKSICIEDKKINIFIADTEKTRKKGLSHSSFLNKNEGMLFLFEEEGYHGMWMKDMKYSLDILWLDSNFTIVGVEKNVSPDTFPLIFYPQNPALFVLETNTGKEEWKKIGEKMFLCE
jgi:uncharacterized membrane protein (UPF0127 family)